jgi:hypothetical protein
MIRLRRAAPVLNTEPISLSTALNGSSQSTTARGGLSLALFFFVVYRR